MKEIEELLKSVLTVEDGLKIISNLESMADVKSGKNISGETSNEMLEEFKAAYYRMQVVSLTLAIKPTLELLRQLQEFFSQNLGEKVVFDLTVDSQIIGGVKMICRDHFRDMTLAARIDEVSESEVVATEIKPEFMPSTQI